MNLTIITSLVLISSLVCLCTGLIRNSEDFNPEEDARHLRQALMHSNVRAVTNILTRRSDMQRNSISIAYSEIHKRSLVQDLKSELSGDHENLMVALAYLLQGYYARELYLDAQPFVPDTKACLDIVGVESYYHLLRINESFNRLKLHWRFDAPTILTVVFQGLSGRMIFGNFNGERNRTQEVDVNAATADAKLIRDIGEGTGRYAKGFTQNRQIEKIFITNSYNQLREIISQYQTLYGHGIEKAFEDRGFEDDVEKEVLNLIPIIKSTSDYFATRLYDSMHGIGTDDRSLIRIIVGHSERDMDDIKAAFVRKYGISLESMIRDDTSGEYQYALLRLIEDY